MTSNLNEEDGGHPKVVVEAAPDANGTQRAIQVLLESLCHGHVPVDEAPPAPVDKALDLLHDRAALSRT